jgi:hypothetical protein
LEEDGLSSEERSEGLEGGAGGGMSEGEGEVLRGSVDRLREFVGGLGEDRVGTVPVCVEEYCDKMSEYRVKCGSEVILIAERRLNK